RLTSLPSNEAQGPLSGRLCCGAVCYQWATWGVRHRTAVSRVKSNSSPTGLWQPAVFPTVLIGTRVAQSHCHYQFIRNAQFTRHVESIAAGPAAVSSDSCFLARCRQGWEEPIPIALPGRQHVWSESQNQGTAGDRDHGAAGFGFLRRVFAPRRSGGVAG